ncbi:MAG: tRNA preQ1(34) S-adenosylmethionine ribosyltransferase-isomerase QueA [Planctomycetia bacterium]
MRLDLLDFDLPPRLIAQEPAATREGARLLVLDRHSGAREHAHVPRLLGLLRAGDLLVDNDTKVRPASLFARRASGGAVELLLLEPAPALGSGLWRSLLRANRPVREGEVLQLTDGQADIEGCVRLAGRDAEGLWLVSGEGTALEQAMARGGVLPLPPYIHREARDRRTALDRERYQTVYAREEGAVAAPTAGLHLTQALLDGLAAAGVARASVTLHVGLGTFQPVRVDDLDQHRMHREAWQVPEATAQAVRATRARGGRIVAVGTTTVRTLEAAALACADGLPAAGAGSTDLLIQPGHVFRAVDALLTNFHLPRSTLLALVAAFTGREPMLAAYREAVAQGYRFFSYGDAMFIA